MQKVVQNSVEYILGRYFKSTDNLPSLYDNIISFLILHTVLKSGLWQKLKKHGSALLVEMRVQNGWESARLVANGILWWRRLWAKVMMEI